MDVAIKTKQFKVNCNGATHKNKKITEPLARLIITKAQKKKTKAEASALHFFER